MNFIRGAVFHRQLNKPMVVAIRAKDMWIEASDGKRYLDASGGAVVVNIGHCREEVAQAVFEQLRTLSYVHGTMFTNRPLEELAQALTVHTPGDLNRFYFLTSGSEAVEAAIKLARQIHLAEGRAERHVIVSRWKSYHGLTMGALAAAGRTYFRKPFYPMIRDAVHIPPPYCLRCSYGLAFPGCNLRCAWALDEIIQNIGPEVVSAFLAETVSGATLAAYPPPDGYWPLIREICNRHGVLLILDEVMCGMGRTGRWFGADHYGIVPDMMTLGKGLSGGTMALSALAVRHGHMEKIRNQDGNFAHGGTFSHHAVACAAGLATVRLLERDGLIQRAADVGNTLGQRLGAGLSDHPHVADVRGVGMMWGVEFVKDKEHLTPYPRSEKVAERLWDALFDRGVITYKSVGLAGIDGDALMVAPPFIVNEGEIEIIMKALTETIDGTLK
jgi:adenosylmethionine-8-amino-7-oxononanoate aminotransferase